MGENKIAILNKAIEITKEFGRGGSTLEPDEVLENLYNKLKVLYEDANTEK